MILLHVSGQVHQKPGLETQNIQIHNILYYQYKIYTFHKAFTPSPFKDQPLQTFLLQHSLQAVQCSSPHRLKLSSNTIKAKIKNYLWSFTYYLFLSLCMSMCQMFVATSANQLFSVSVAVIILFGYYICV